ncbi:glycolate oxidase FAD binding subunit [Loktanella sp. DSM 29012]|uniref:FAD-binding protein n=1 Tax=Loktanella sp. DSM 29012 TaxID=1881056 RepID=UPI0008D61C01|nr:FAD-binding protein [Loktanella sp. DSM 29012]SEQ41749.1 glycolate oxidase FAD binding subunit [Loktanella sp. DSM 29012]
MTLQTEDDVADFVRAAKGPVAVRGGGTRAQGGVDETLPVAGLSGITLYEPGALTLVAKAGTPMTEIETALAAERQQLAFEPMDHRALLGTAGVPTIGGVVATNASGPRRIQVGACRDHLLGVRFVDGSGTVVKNGGRVMKNVTGYDLVKLLAGSYGTLGVLTEVSLKVLPLPERVATLTTVVPDAAAAVRILSDALGSPYDVTGAAAAQDGDGFRVHVRVEGFDDSVGYRAAQLRDLLHLDDGADPWADLRDVTALGDCPFVVRVSVRPSQAAALLSRMDGMDRVQLDWSGGLIWLGGAEAALLAQAQAICADIGGHATGIKGDFGPLPRFQPQPAPLAAISAGLRAKFDPRGILNPGVMG